MGTFLAMSNGLPFETNIFFRIDTSSTFTGQVVSDCQIVSKLNGCGSTPMESLVNIKVTGNCGDSSPQGTIGFNPSPNNIIIYILYYIYYIIYIILYYIIYIYKNNLIMIIIIILK